MKKFLNNLRSTNNPIPFNKQIIDTVCILFAGIVLGTFSKFWDFRQAELPSVLMAIDGALDVHNFLGRFAIWALIALCISIYSNSAIRASVNVFAFFVGMVTSYYLYSKFVAGFFPKSYALIWIGFTFISPLLAFVCWYAKGNSKPALVLSAMTLAVLFDMTFVYGNNYFEMRSILELITFICGVAVLRQRTIKNTMIMLAIGIGIAFILNLIMPFGFGSMVFRLLNKFKT